MAHFESFQKGFKGDIVTPSDPGYKEAIARWASNAERDAKIVAFVKDAEDVSATIAFAKASKLPLAIRGGGHSASGASSCQDGIVIDLSRHINGVRIDSENKLAYAGGGALWATVDKAAIEYGLAGVAGTVNHTGVGGLTLGGGFGFLSGAYGMVCDNLKQVTIVTADGSVLTVNDELNSDLFWAVRGGGCNFGVVTEFVYQLHPQRRHVFAGIVVFPQSVLDKLVFVTNEWWGNGHKPSGKEAMLQVLMIGPDRTPCATVLLFYNGSEEEGRKKFKAFFDLQPIMDATKEIPYEELNGLSKPFLVPGFPTYMKGVFQTKPRVEVSENVLSCLAELTKDRPDAQITILFEYFPLSKITSVPRGATPFNRLPYPNVVNITRWKDNTSEWLTWAQLSSQKILGIVLNGNDQVSGDQISNGYGNYDPEVDAGVGGTISNKAEALFGANYPRLQQLKKKYDPEVLFSKWFLIQPQN